MTWTKVPDDATETLWDLSAGAFRLHLSGYIYANRHLTDGYVPESRLAALVPGYEPAQLAELLDAHRWQRVDGGYQLPGWNTPKRDPWHQETRAEVEARRAKNAADVAEWRKRNPGKAVTGAVTKPLTPGTGESLENVVPVPGVSQLHPPRLCYLCGGPGIEGNPLINVAQGRRHRFPTPCPSNPNRGRAS
jgi:hypothetical protein